MAAHSSILAWRIPWTEELGRLQSSRVENSWTLQIDEMPGNMPSWPSTSLPRFPLAVKKWPEQSQAKNGKVNAVYHKDDRSEEACFLNGPA